MTIKKLTYIGLAFCATALMGCSDDVAIPNTLSGDGTKTPLEVSALLDAGSVSTRAADKSFDITTGDQLLAYLRHVKWDGNTNTARSKVNDGSFDKLVSFIAKDNTPYTGDDIKPIGLGGNIVVATKTNNVTNQASIPNSGIYWDDFSANSSADGTGTSTYLRDTGHYLQSYYGYCYNGGTPIIALGHDDNHKEADGILDWAVSTDQSAADKSAFKTSDLLWSAEQTPISYVHQDQQAERNHGTLILPYTHAMSKVTINVKLHESFGTGANFSGVKTTLHEMFSTCTCKAPTYEFTRKGAYENSVDTKDATENIIMWNKESVNTEKTTNCTFEAIVVPSVLSVVNNFASIEGLEGNKYIVPITEEMLLKGSEHAGKGWGDELTETKEHISGGTAQAPQRTRSTTIDLGKGYEMKPGVNYVLNVEISKQDISISATIKDWVNVEADGVAIVQFNPDVNGKGSIADELKNFGFDVYKSDDNTAFDTKITTLTWDETNTKWNYSQVTYWAGQDDASYFRGIWPAGNTLVMNQNKDVLWGYACDDDANNGSKVGTENEVAINPRTGDVPLHFEHPMSKISVELKTSDVTPSDSHSPAVDLTDAKIEICNLATSGTLSLVDGSIIPATIIPSAITGINSISNLPVIPQEIGNDAFLKVTLSDGTVYKLQLNTCVDSNSTTDPKPAIKTWERGKHYTYTIQVDKEAILFRGMVKDWDPVTGSGSANLDWD